MFGGAVYVTRIEAVVLLDGSGSIGEPSYDQATAFIRQFASAFQLSQVQRLLDGGTTAIVLSISKPYLSSGTGTIAALKLDSKIVTESTESIPVVTFLVTDDQQT